MSLSLHKCHQFLQYFILKQQWVLDSKMYSEWEHPFYIILIITENRNRHASGMSTLVVLFNQNIDPVTCIPHSRFCYELILDWKLSNWAKVLNIKLMLNTKNINFKILRISINHTQVQQKPREKARTTTPPTSTTPTTTKLVAAAGVWVALTATATSTTAKNWYEMNVISYLPFLSWHWGVLVTRLVSIVYISCNSPRGLNNFQTR